MKIISGGQTGADRAALEFARWKGFQTGGWCPAGYRTDDGPDPSLAEFGLVCTKSIGYAKRTYLNVLNSDGTLLFGNMDSPGCRLTIKYCINLGKPYLYSVYPLAVGMWICLHHIDVLNVAGNRERTNPGIGYRVKRYLMNAFEFEANAPLPVDPGEPTPITQCDSCKRGQSRISPRDTQRLPEFPGYLLKCGHKVCGECFPYCDACDPIPF